MASNPLADTGEFEVPAVKPAPGPPCIPLPTIDVRVAGESHRGLVRSNNEDCFFVTRYGRSLQTLLTNVPDEYLLPSVRDIGYGMLVADGMGGTAAGEVASRSAVQCLLELLRDTRSM